MNKEATKGDFLKRKRIEKGVKLKEVAKDTRMSPSSIYAIEAGSRNLTARIVEEIMYAIGIEDKYKRFLLYPDGILNKGYLTQGEYLKLKRMDIGLNVSDLAQYIGISVSMLSYIESGSRRITKDIFYKLAKPLDINIDYEEFMRDNLNVYLIYTMDEEWGIPIIDNFYFSAEKAISKKKEYEVNNSGLLWKVIEFKIIGCK